MIINKYNPYLGNLQPGVSLTKHKLNQAIKVLNELQPLTPLVYQTDFKGDFMSYENFTLNVVGTDAFWQGSIIVPINVQ